MKEITKANLYLKLFGLTKIPLILFCNPKIIELNDQKIVVRIPLRYRTKNHLNSMYFGALAVGADIAGGLLAFHQMEKKKLKISLVFKELKAEFLKRPDGDVHFTCSDGELIAEMVNEAAASGERVERPVTVIATVPSIDPGNPVAKFELILSIKKSNKS